MKLGECTICEEVGINMKVYPTDEQTYCAQCKRELLLPTWSGIHIFSADNDISPGDIPTDLLALGKPSPLEAMMLATVHSVIRIYKVRRYGQYKGGKVHVINFPQDPTEVFHIIPRLPHELPLAGLRVKGLEGIQRQDQQARLKDFEINILRVRAWMDYLCQHNR